MGKMIYISHGGGPLPILGDKGHAGMLDFLRRLPENIGRPDEILVISAHWEESVPTLIGPDVRDLFFDYYGFPPESYNISYPFTGNPGLVTEVQSRLREGGIESSINSERGLDHGVFIPLMLLYPDGNIPVTQLSLIRGLDPAAHLSLGQALSGLLERNILIIGSGFSFHNMRLFFHGNGEDQLNNEFQDWLLNIITERTSPEHRLKVLEKWEEAPGARHCHPREEHLLPLHVCAGVASGAPGEVIFDGDIMGKRSIAFKW